MVVVRDSPLVVEAGGLFLCPARSTASFIVAPHDQVVAAERVTLRTIILVPIRVVLSASVLRSGDQFQVIRPDALPVRAARATVTRSGLDRLSVADVIDLVSVGEVAIVDPVGVLVGEPPWLPWSWAVVSVTVGCLGVPLK